MSWPNLGQQLKEKLAWSEMVTPSNRGNTSVAPQGVPKANNYQRAKSVLDRLEKEFNELYKIQAPSAAEIERMKELNIAIHYQKKTMKQIEEGKNQFKDLFPNAPLLQPASNGYQSNEGFANKLLKGIGFAGGRRRKTRKGKGRKGKSRRRNRK